MRSALTEGGLEEMVEVDSAGTHGYHVGEAPDERAREVGAARGYDLSRLRARKVSSDDFGRFDLILAMDAGNLANLRRGCPPEHLGKVRLFLECASVEAGDVPDPYYGNLAGFERVIDLCEAGARGLVEAFRSGRLPLG